MKLIVGLAQRIYSIYAFILFFIFLIVIFIWVVLSFGLLSERQRLRGFYRCNQLCMTLWGWLTGIRFVTEHAEKKQKDETYVITPNHVNMLDIIMAGSRVIHDFRVLAKKEFKKIPVMGQIVGLVAITVDRSNKENRQQSLEEMKQWMDRGTSIMIFPEGSRNRSNEILAPFYNGAFSLAIQAQKPILPVILLDHRKLQPIHTFLLKPGKVRVRFLDPEPVAGLSNADLPWLKEQVFNRMKEAIIRHDKDFHT